MKHIIFFIVLSLTQSMALANHEELLKQAHNALTQKDFQTALDIYSKVESSAMSSASMYQNMALAYAGLHQDGMAILYLEKALKYKPNDPSLNENLNAIVKRNSQIDNTSQTTQLSTLVNRWIGFLSINGWLLISVLAFAGIGILIFINYPKLSNNKKINIVAIILSVIFLLSTSAAYLRHQYIYHNQGIIITKSDTMLKIGPDLDSPDLGDLPVGSKVTMVEYIDGWWMVINNYGDKGWIQADAGKKI